MQTRKRFLALGLCGCWVLVILAFSGCGDAQSRQAGQQLRKAVREARELCGAAQSMLASPEIGEGGGLLALPDPQIEQLLNEAEQVLRSAKSESGSISSDSIARGDLALARQTEGMVSYLLGEYHSAIATHHMYQAEESAQLAQWERTKVQDIQTRARSMETLLASDLGALQEVGREAEALRQTQQQKKTQADQQLQQLQAQKKDLEEQTTKNDVEASSLRAKSTLARGEESRELLNQSLALEKQSRQNRYRIKQIQQQIERLEADRRQATYRIAQAEETLQSVQKIITNRQAASDRVRTSLGEVQSQLGAAVSDLSTQLSAVADASRKAMEHSAQAEQNYQQSATSLQAAVQQGTSGKKSQMLSELASVKAALGRLKLAQYGLSQRLLGLASGVEQTASQPGTDAGLSQPLSAIRSAVGEQASEAGQQAAAAWGEAVDILERAVSAADREERWRMELKLGLAQVNMAVASRVAGDATKAAEAMTAARELLPEVQSAAAQAGQPSEALKLQQAIERAG